MLGLEGMYSLPELSRMVTQHTGKSVKQLTGIRPGVWYAQLGAGTYVLKVRKHRAHLVDEQQVLKALGTFGVPVERLLHIWPIDADRALCLYAHVDGAPLALDAALSRAADLGRSIGILHRGLATVVGKTDRRVGKLPETIIYSVVPALAQTGSPLLIALKEQLLANEAALCDLQGLPRQLIHRDAHIGNMLFRNDTFGGWVDFDLLETNFRLFDVCYCAAGLLAARFTDAAWRNEWFPAVRTMVQAYSEVVGLVPAEVEAVWMMMVAIEALFVGIGAQRDPRMAERTAAICLWLFEQRHRWRPYAVEGQ